MRIKKERKPIHLNCVDCGAVFTAFNSNALRCPKCRAAHKNQEHKEYQASQRARARSSTIKPNMSVGEVLKAMERYNKAHGTHLSYGKFVSHFL